LLAVPMPDQPDSGEVAVMVLDILEEERRAVAEFAETTSERLWGDEPWTAFVFAIGRKAGPIRYSHLLRAARRRRIAAPARRRRRPATSRA